MTYEDFKQCVIRMATNNKVYYYGNVHNALLNVWMHEGHSGANSEKIMQLAYKNYCRICNIEPEPRVINCTIMTNK